MDRFVLGQRIIYRGRKGTVVKCRTQDNGALISMDDGPVNGDRLFNEDGDRNEGHYVLLYPEICGKL